MSGSGQFVVAAADVVGPHLAGVVEKEIHDCFALLHPVTNEVLVLNDSASDIWRLSDGEFTLETIVHLLARAYSADVAAIREDVERTVTLLRRRGFLVPDSAGGSSGAACDTDS